MEKWFYGYDWLRRDLDGIAGEGATVGSFGKSELGRELLFVKVGSGGKRIIVTGGIHARENITVETVAEQALYSLRGYEGGELYFLPMLNPDGATLVESGTKPFGRLGEWLKQINGSEDFTLWKANAYGVDLNVNFDAGWGTGRQNRFSPASESFVGDKPFSAAETEALRRFTLSVMPHATVSYHAKGREIYWYFHQEKMARERDLRLTNALNRRLGYRVAGAATDSAGGYKDWCVEKLGIFACTLEIGRDVYSHLLPRRVFFEEWRLNCDLPLRLVEELRKEDKNGKS